MRRFVLLVLLTASLVNVVKAQEVPGDKADSDEIVKREILKIEQEKIPALTGNGSDAADWVNRIDADDIVIVGADGRLTSKAQHVVGFQSGEVKDLSIHDDDFRVRVYAGGSTAVVTYRGNNTIQRSGIVTRDQNRTTDVFVKQNGEWRRVVHHVTGLPKQ